MRWSLIAYAKLELIKIAPDITHNLSSLFVLFFLLKNISEASIYNIIILVLLNLRKITKQIF